MTPIDETVLAARVSRARSFAVVHRYGEAIGALDFPDVLAWLRESDHPDAPQVLSDLAWWLAWGGDSGRSLSVYEEVLARPGGLDRHLRYDVLSRRAYVIGMAREGQASAVTARDAFAGLARLMQQDAEASPGLLFHVRRQHARWVGTAGDEAHALELLRALEGQRPVGVAPDSRHALLLMSNIAYFTSRLFPDDPVRTEEALERYCELIELRTHSLGPNDPDTLDARRNEAWVLARIDVTAARARLEALEADARGALGASHRYLVAIQLDAAVVASRLGEPTSAVHMIQSVTRAMLAVSRPEEVLNEYGIVGPPIQKLSEVGRFLAGSGGRAEPLAAVSARECGALVRALSGSAWPG